MHDIGLRIVRNGAGETGFKVLVGGGMGRTPFIAKTVREFLPRDELLAYLEAIMRVYNLEGRRDNKYKARIKILVHEIGTEPFIARVEEEYAKLDGPSVNADPVEVARIAAYFAPPEYETLPAESAAFEAAKRDPAFARFAETNLFPHKVPGYTALTVSLKPIGLPPGDASSDQMRVMADLAERYSLDELRVTHVQNIVLPNVRLDDVPAVWAALVEAGLEAPQCRPDHRHHLLPRHGLLQAGHRPLDPDRAGDFQAFRRRGTAAADRPARHQDIRLHQRLRPPSCRRDRHPRPR